MSFSVVLWGRCFLNEQTDKMFTGKSVYFPELQFSSCKMTVSGRERQKAASTKAQRQKGMWNSRGNKSPISLEQKEKGEK